MREDLQVLAETAQAGGIIQYAQKIVSDTDRRNGLYWKVDEGEISSLLGPFFAQATAKGYTKKGDKPTPYHGYYFKILKGQGKNAPGGAYQYVINGHMVAGSHCWLGLRSIMSPA